MTGQLVTINEVDTVDIRPKVNEFQEMAEALEIKNDMDYQSAAELEKQARVLNKYIEDRFKKTKNALNEAKSELMQMIKSFTVPLQEAVNIIKDRKNTYWRKKEQERLAEQRRLQAEEQKAEEDRRLNEAIDTGDEDILNEPVIAPEVQIENTLKVDGEYHVDVPKFEIVDETKIPREYLMPDEQKIRRVVNAAKGKIEILGVRIWVEKQSRMRTT